MEFHEKLAELRKSKGLTQEELAGALYVSRTAVSKWESGRGYPSIDSLKEISRYFTAAEDDKKVMIGRYVAVICNTLDLLTAVLLFLPIFGNGADSPTSVSLFQITGTAPWAKAVFIAVIGIITLNGLCGVILSRFDRPVWNRHRMVTGMALSVAAVGIFIGTRQPYAGIICFAILVIKGWLIFKGKTEAAGPAD